jgi:hypothetical protein
MAGKINAFLHDFFCVFLLVALMNSSMCRSFAQDSAPDGWDIVYDFMVQDVCTDASGKVLLNISPVDGPQNCPRHRNLRVGEKLPYHKHDWANLSQRSQLPLGYQREDSFPIRTRLLGTAVAQTFDFGGGERSFGQFDHGDGGQIVVFSAQSIAIGLTEAGNGLHFFFGPQCNASQERLRILDSWVIVDNSFSPNVPGMALSRLERNMAACPDRLGSAIAQWHVAWVTFQVRTKGSDQNANLKTLISDHFAGSNFGNAPHLERFYFTRELGWTRWERWENLMRQEVPDAREKATQLSATGRCEHVEEKPEPPGEWIMIDCRQWTNIVTPSDPTGDTPNFWIDRLKVNFATSSLFAD